jgi:hypothetical protein
MKWSYLFVFITALLGVSCREEFKSSVADDEMIEYQLKKGQYAVVIIMDGVTMEQAKKTARHRAAQIAVSGGYRYFLIQSETQTQVVKQKAENHEMFIEGQFAKNQAITETVSPALRVVFQCFEKKPHGKAIKACNLTDCSKLGSGNP